MIRPKYPKICQMHHIWHICPYRIKLGMMFCTSTKRSIKKKHTELDPSPESEFRAQLSKCHRYLNHHLGNRKLGKKSKMFMDLRMSRRLKRENYCRKYLLPDSDAVYTVKVSESVNHTNPLLWIPSVSDPAAGVILMQELWTCRRCARWKSANFSVIMMFGSRWAAERNNLSSSFTKMLGAFHLF